MALLNLEQTLGESLEHAREGIEHAHHALEEGEFSARNIAIVISFLAAGLAIAEMGEKASQNEYLTHHVSLSDDWAFYQAKTVRWNMLLSNADILDSLPNAATDPAIRARAAKAREDAARMNDDEKTQGRKQLQEKAQQQGEERDHAFHRYHNYEWVVGALQIAIVLASVSVVTKVRVLAMIAGGIGGIAALFGLAVAGGLV